MASEDDFEAKFPCTKSTWKGKYFRLFAMSRNAFATIKPEDFNITHDWKWSQLLDVQIEPRDPEEFTLTIYDASKVTKEKFRSKYRSYLLPELFRLRRLSGPTQGALPPNIHPAVVPPTLNFECSKKNRAGQLTHLTLQVSLEAVYVIREGASPKPLHYNFIQRIRLLNDKQDGIVLDYCGRARLIYSPQRQELVAAVKTYAQSSGIEVNFGGEISEAAIDEEIYLYHSLISYEHTYATFSVNKRTERHQEGVARNLLFTSSHLLERETTAREDDLSILTARPYKAIYLIVRHPNDPNRVDIEYMDGSLSTFISPDCSQIVTLLLDLCQLLGLRDVGVTYDGEVAGDRVLPRGVPEDHAEAMQSGADTSIGAFYLRRIVSASKWAGGGAGAGASRGVLQMIDEFNANVPASGIPVPITRQLLSDAIKPLVGNLHRMCQTDNPPPKATITLLQCLYRLSETPGGGKEMLSPPLYRLMVESFCRIFRSVKQDELVTHWTCQLFRSLLNTSEEAGGPDMATKRAVLQDGSIAASLAKTMTDNGEDGRKFLEKPSLLISGLLHTVEIPLCLNRFNVGGGLDRDIQRMFLTIPGAIYSSLLSLVLNAVCPSIIESSTMLLKTFVEEGDIEAVNSIRDSALSEAVVLKQLYRAIFDETHDGRFVNRFLCSLWMSHHPPSKALLRRIFPSGLLDALSSPPLSLEEMAAMDTEETNGMGPQHQHLGAGGEDNYNVGNGRSHGQSLLPQPSTDSRASFRRSSVASLLKMRLESSHSIRSISSINLVGGSSIDSARTTASSSSSGRPAVGTDKQNDHQAFVSAVHTSNSSSRHENFFKFFHMIEKDHHEPTLVWNSKTRANLLHAFESELFEVEKAQREVEGGIAWNHEEFRVEYRCLDEYIKVGNIYPEVLLLLLEGERETARDKILQIVRDPGGFMLQLYQHFLEGYAKAEVDGVISTTVLCLRCLKEVYTLCHERVGVFPATPKLVRVLKETWQVPIFRTVLDLICVLVAKNRENAESLLSRSTLEFLVSLLNNVHAAKIDDASFGIGPDQRFKAASLTPRLADHLGEWFYKLPLADGTYNGDTAEGPVTVEELKQLLEQGVIGTSSPVRPASTSSSSSSVSPMASWLPLRECPHLRWRLLLMNGELDHIRVGHSCLAILRTLLGLHGSLLRNGRPVRPLPLAQRTLSRPDLLKSIARALLCIDDEVVEQTAELLVSLLDENESAIYRFYETGALYFLLLYTGKNFLPLARLLEKTHLKQKSLGNVIAYDTDNGAVDLGSLAHNGKSQKACLCTSMLSRLLPTGIDGLPSEAKQIWRQSALSKMLPEALVIALITRGPEHFTQLFISEVNSPEVIWLRSMRETLIAMLMEHLGDFPARIRQNTELQYDFVPIAPIVYEELREEFYCCNYYLKNLCNDSLFPDWTIEDPLKLMRSLYLAWRFEEDKVEVEINVDDAIQTLALPSKKDLTPEAVRTAYRRLARICYSMPEVEQKSLTFRRIDSAYQALALARNKLKTSGTDPVHISLILKAQILVCKRHSQDLKMLRYDGFSLLMPLITVRDEEKETGVIPPMRLEQFCLGADLAYSICVASVSNAIELLRVNGVQALDGLLSFCLKLMKPAYDPLLRDRGPPPTPPSHPIMKAAINVMHTISGLAALQEGRRTMQLETDLAMDVCNALLFYQSAELMQYVLDAISRMAQSEELQDALLRAGVMWYLVWLCFRFEKGVYVDIQTQSLNTVEANSPEAINVAAHLAVRALARIGGYLKNEYASPVNEDVQLTLAALFTPMISSKLSNPNAEVFLETFHKDSQTPLVIWNEAMRSELKRLIMKQLRRFRKGKPYNPQKGLQQRYQQLKNMPAVGGVFLYVYDMNPKFPLEEPIPQQFTLALLKYIANDCENPDEEISPPYAGWAVMEPAYKPANLRLALKCLAHVVTQYTSVVLDSIVLAEDDGIPCLLEFLLPPGDDGLCIPPKATMDYAKRRECVLLVLEAISHNEMIADSVGKSGQLWKFLRLAHRLDESGVKALNILAGLCCATSVVECLATTGLIVDLVCLVVEVEEYMSEEEYTAAESLRRPAAIALSRAAKDPVCGNNVNMLLGRIFPAPMLKILLTDPPALVDTFEGTSDTPELVWNYDIRVSLRDSLYPIFEAYQRHPVGTPFFLPEHFVISYPPVPGDVLIGQVYVKKFLADPMFALSNTRFFLASLFDAFNTEVNVRTAEGQRRGVYEDPRLIQGGEDILQLVTAAIVFLLRLYSEYFDQIIQWGFPLEVVSYLQNANSRGATPLALTSCLRLLQAFSGSRRCIQTIASPNLLLSLKVICSGAQQKDLGLIAELIRKVIQCWPESDDRTIPRNQPSGVVAACLRIDLIPFLLSCLDDPATLQGALSPDSARLNLIEAISILEADPRNFAFVNEVLKKHKSWGRKWKVQRASNVQMLDLDQSDVYMVGPAKTGAAIVQRFIASQPRPIAVAESASIVGVGYRPSESASFAGVANRSIVGVTPRTSPAPSSSARSSTLTSATGRPQPATAAMGAPGGRAPPTSQPAESVPSAPGGRQTPRHGSTVLSGPSPQPPTPQQRQQREEPKTFRSRFFRS